MSEVPVQSSSTGLAPNVAGALSYVFGIITGVLFLILEKRDSFVRFHAAQSIVVSVAVIAAWVGLTILSAILGVVPVIGWLVGLGLSLVFGLLSLGLWLYMMFQAFQGKEWEVPYLGEQARRHILSPPAA